MNQTKEPPWTVWKIIKDGVPETPTGASWQSATVYRLVFSGSPATSGTVQLIERHVDLRGTDDSVVKPSNIFVFYP